MRGCNIFQLQTERPNVENIYPSKLLKRTAYSKANKKRLTLEKNRESHHKKYIRFPKKLLMPLKALRQLFKSNAVEPPLELETELSN